MDSIIKYLKRIKGKGDANSKRLRIQRVLFHRVVIIITFKVVRISFEWIIEQRFDFTNFKINKRRERHKRVKTNIKTVHCLERFKRDWERDRVSILQFFPSTLIALARGGKRNELGAQPNNIINTSVRFRFRGGPISRDRIICLARGRNYLFPRRDATFSYANARVAPVSPE